MIPDHLNHPHRDALGRITTKVFPGYHWLFSWALTLALPYICTALPILGFDGHDLTLMNRRNVGVEWCQLAGSNPVISKGMQKSKARKEPWAAEWPVASDGVNCFRRSPIKSHVPYGYISVVVSGLKLWCSPHLMFWCHSIDCGGSAVKSAIWPVQLLIDWVDFQRLSTLAQISHSQLSFSFAINWTLACSTEKTKIKRHWLLFGQERGNMVMMTD